MPTAQAANSSTTDDGVEPVWSPDGSRLAYRVPHAGIWVVDADGTDAHRLIQGDARNPVWSPDGSRLAYNGGGDGLNDSDWVGDRNDSVGIRVVDVDGSNRQTLTEGGEHPDWSPDGSRITYQGSTVWTLADGRLITDESSLGIWVVDADGGNNRRLTDGDKDRLPRLPSWSPDGSSIIYTVLRGPVVVDMYVMNTDGSDRQLLTRNGHYPVWSPDGDRIVYVSAARNKNSGSIFVMNSDGSNGQSLLSSGTSPVWSPDGESIAYTSEQRAGFYTMDENGANQRAYAHITPGDLESQDLEAWDAIWAPDGTAVAYNDGNTLRVRIADDSNADWYLSWDCLSTPKPLWSPDSTYIGFRGKYGNIEIVEVETGRRVREILDSNDLVWLPDGDRIAHTNREGTFVSEIDGGNKRQLYTRRVADIAFSPDSTQVAFALPIGDSLNLDRQYAIHVMNADGTNEQQITIHHSLRVYNLTWSPDGTQIAYTTDKQLRRRISNTV